MDPSELILPVLGIAAAAVLTFYSVSFTQMSDKSFEDVAERGVDPTVLRSAKSNKERRKARSKSKEQQ